MIKNISIIHAVVIATINAIFIIVHELRKERKKCNPKWNIQQQKYLLRNYHDSNYDYISMNKMKRDLFFKLCGLICSNFKYENKRTIG